MDLGPIAQYLKDFDGMLVMEIIGDGDLEGAVLRSRGYLEAVLAVN